MPSFPRIPQALRSRRAQAPRPPGAVATPGRAWPSPTVIFRGPQLLMRGPRLLLRGPRLLLRAPGAILRTPSSVRARLFSSSRARRQKNVEGQPHEHAPEAGPSSEPSQGSFTCESPFFPRALITARSPPTTPTPPHRALTRPRFRAQLASGSASRARRPSGTRSPSRSASPCSSSSTFTSSARGSSRAARGPYPKARSRSRAHGRCAFDWPNLLASPS